MQNKQRYFTAGVTIAAAAVTAHLMQRDTGSSAQPIGPATAAVVPSLSSVAQQPPVRVQNEVTLVALAAEDEAESVPTPADMVAAADLETAPVEALVPAELSQEVIAKIAPPAAAPPAAPEVEGQRIEIALADPSEQDSRPAETGVEFIVDFPRPPADVLVPGPMPKRGADLADRMAEASSTTPDLNTEPERNQFGLPCGPILSASPVVDGLINVILTAPCRGEETITVRHSAIAFTDQVDTMGTFQITVPALVSPAVFSVDFGDGETVSTEVDVDSVEGLERVALVSDRESGLQIHALEFGADYGEEGHIWSGNPGNPALGALDGKGYVLRLGNETLEGAQIAEVYTFPRAGSTESGTVRLSVEAEVTLGNCAKDITGLTIEPQEGGGPAARNLEVAMPDCEAVGEFLVLKNLLRDLRIVSN